ncbi:MAG: iron-containing alcohol dehydrogenase, partial [Nocardioidaceae bacterium]|nr:iron-containing alcohol dehydrogenase [Nocardioidaceae bacterium]
MLSSERFTVAPPGTIEFGEGALQTLGAAVTALGRTRAFVVTDAGIVRAGIVASVEQVLTDSGVDFEVFS